jgi:NarL family two-component system response regulator LiaR
VIGAVVATFKMPNLAVPILVTVVVTALLLLMPATFLGTLFGFLTAWSLTRCLGRLARAAQNWSRGDFSEEVKDRSKDELGQLTRELNSMASQLETLLQTRGELATLEARNRFARDLHDSVKQQVFATSLQIATARSLLNKDHEATEEHLAQAGELVRQAQKELNVLIHEMRPAALEDKGLAKALREYAAKWSKGSEIPSEVHVRGEREVPLETEQTVFRIAQEALANVAKHSGAEGAELDLIYTPETLTLRVADDGRGFDPAQNPGEGFGLQSMRERAIKYGGHINVESTPGKGTPRYLHRPVKRRPRERRKIMGEQITVLLVDDHALVRQGVRAFLETQPDISVIAEAGNGEEAVKCAAEYAPDVALMDLIMPGMDGVEATRRLVARSPRTNVVMLTSYHDDEHVFPAIRAGALSYVLKEIGPEELAEAVRKAAAGEAVLHPRVAARVMRELHGARRDAPNVFHELSDREMEVLKLIADGCTNAEIAGRLYLSEKTIKSHVSNILGKLHLADRTQAAVYAWREGVVRRD